MIASEDFENLARRHRRELLVHAYRMLGSVTEAEDALQEALIRAWKSLAQVEERAKFRAWLYKITTNCCLDQIGKRKDRVLAAGEPADPKAPPSAPSSEIEWLEPIPDELLEPDPEDRYIRHERVELAFLAALQKLPGRQRASLLLSEVVGFSAAEIAELLETSTASVNSALQRARENLKDAQLEKAEAAVDADTKKLLERYLIAWRAFDASALVAMLREDAVLTMPPMATWISGAENIVAFWSAVVAPGAEVRVVRANGQPAFLVGGVALQVPEVRDGKIAAVHTFLDPKVVTRFA